MTSLGFGWTKFLVVLVLVATASCRRTGTVDQSKRPADAGSESAEDTQANVAAEQEEAAAKQALARWVARMKAIQGALAAAQQLKPGCDSLVAQSPLASVDTELLESVKRSPNGAVPAVGSAGFASLQSRAVRDLFHAAHRERTPSPKKLIAASVELDAAKFLAVFELSEVARPKMLSKDSWAGGSMRGALVVFDLSHDVAVCRIPLVAKSPSKSDVAKRYGGVDTTGIDLERQVLDFTAMELRHKAEERLRKPGVTLAESAA